MLKKILSIILSVIIIMNLFSFNANASALEKTSKYEKINYELLL